MLETRTGSCLHPPFYFYREEGYVIIATSPEEAAAIVDISTNQIYDGYPSGGSTRAGTVAIAIGDKALRDRFKRDLGIQGFKDQTPPAR